MLPVSACKHTAEDDLNLLNHSLNVPLRGLGSYLRRSSDLEQGIAKFIGTSGVTYGCTIGSLSIAVVELNLGHFGLD